MKVIDVNGTEVHLQGNQAFLYKGQHSEVLNINGIENDANAEELILRELELISCAKFTQTKAFN